MYRLRRVSKKESRFLGVCGGISKYIDPDMDPVIIRIIWVILIIFSIPPFMILFYFILALVLKREEPKEEENKQKVNIKFKDEDESKTK